MFSAGGLAPRENTGSATAYVQPRQQAHKTRDETGAQHENHSCKKVSNRSRLILTRGEAKKKRELLCSRVRLRLALHSNPWVFGGIRNHDREKRNFEGCTSSTFLCKAARRAEFLVWSEPHWRHSWHLH